MRTPRSALALLLVAGLAACGDSPTSTPPPPPPDPAAVDAARSTLTAAPASATADGVAAIALTATARDAAGAPLSGRLATFTVQGPAALLSSATATTGAEGTASVALTSTAAGTKDVSVRIDGVAVTARAAPAFVAGPPASVAFTGSPAGGPAGAAFGAAVLVRDAHANPVPGAAVGLALQDGPAGAALAGAAAATTDAAGAATFTGLSVTRAAAGYALLATAGGAQGRSAPFDVTPGAPSVGPGGASTLTPPPGPVPVGPGGASVVATIVDAFGNPVPGVPVTFAATGGTLSAAALPTDAAGQAVVALASTVSGDASVTAAVAGAPVGQPAAVTFAPGPAAGLVVLAQPVAGTAGADLGAILVAAVDAFGNAAALPGQVSATLSVAPAGAVLSGLPVAGGATEATFLGLSIQRAGQVTLRLSSGGLAVETAPIAIAPAAPSPTASLLSVAPASVPAGTAAVARVTALDDFGNPVAGVPVAVASSNATDLVAGPALSGPTGEHAAVVTATAAGVRALSATVGGLPLAATAGLAVTAGPPDAARSTIAGPGAPVVADGAATATISVTLRDAFDNPVPGAPVGFATTAGALAPDAATTGAGGTATATLTSTTLGRATVIATFAGGALQANVDLVAGPAASLALTGLGATTTAGVISQVTLTARDALGHLATGYLGTLRLTSTDAAALLPGDVTFSPADAGVRVVAVQLRTAGARSVTATDLGNPTLAGSAGTTVAPAAAASLALSGLTSPWPAGTPRTASVTARDAFGNLATGYRGAVHLASSDPQATLPGDAAFQPADAGVRAFAGLALATAGLQSVTVADLADASLAATVAGLQVAPAAAASLAFTTQPGDAVAGDLLAPPIAVAVRDAFGNAATGPIEVTVSLSGGAPGAALLGTTQVVASGGAAAFADLSVQQAGAGYRLVAGAAGLPPADSAPFAVAPAAPSPAQGEVSVSPATVAAGAPAALGATVRDLFGNPVPGVAVAFAASGTANAVTQPAAATDAGGVATGALASTRAEPKEVSATAGGVALTARATLSVVAGPPSAAGSTLVVAPASAPDDGTEVVLTATVADRFGNPVSGQAVTFTSSGAATFVQPAGPTAASGVATGRVAALVAGAQTITASAGAAPVAQATVTFAPAPPSATASTVSLAPASVPADAVTAAIATVTVRDRLGRPVPGAAVALAFGGAATVSPPSATTGAAGTAAFALRSAAAGEGLLTATVDPGGAAVVLAARPSLRFVATGFVVGGQVLGLSAPGLVLASPGQPDLAVPAGAASFAFAAPVPTGSAYAVAVAAQPAGLACRVEDGAGVVGEADVTSVVVRCAVPWAQAAAGQQHALGLKANGDLYAWGGNGSGQLGDGTRLARPAPVLIGTGFAAVAAGQFHSLAVTTTGDLYAWGSNSDGQLGDGGLFGLLVPTRIGAGFAAVAAGQFHSLAVTTTGDLYAWGDNSFDQLGDGGTSVFRIVPTLVGAGYAAVAAGAQHSLGLRTGGALDAWGDNFNGQLGDGTRVSRSGPIPVGTGYTAIAAGAFHSLGLRTGGELRSWGDNGSGQLGNGGIADSPTQVLVGTGYAAVAGGGAHSLALTTAGELLAWGRNAVGQLGDGTVTDRPSPAPVGAGFATVAGGANGSFAVTATGELLAWGDDLFGQLGDDRRITRRAPVLVENGLAGVAAGASHSLGITAAGALTAWGDNASGQLGDGTTLTRGVAAPVAGAFGAVTAGAGHTLALTPAGDLFAWGDNALGQLGDGTTTPRTGPVLVGSGFVAAAAGADHSLGLKATGELFAWGGNDFGQRGDASTATRLTPLLVGTGYAAVAAGRFHTLALTSTGELRAWGLNDDGQLGDGTTATPAGPVVVGSGYAAIAAGWFHSLGLTGAGELRAWGRNAQGQLGDGTTTGRPAPVPVGTGYAAASAGADHTLGLTAGGDLLAWGDNVSGQLGDGTVLRRTGPVLVGAGFTAMAAGQAHSLGLTAVGDLYAWGANAQGQLGDRRGPRQLRPIEVFAPPGPDHLVYAPATGTFPAGVAIAPLTPGWSGLATGFEVVPPLPAGLSIDQVTGVISGTPAAASPRTGHAVTATGPGGATTTLVTIAVE